MTCLYLDLHCDHILRQQTSLWTEYAIIKCTVGYVAVYIVIPLDNSHRFYFVLLFLWMFVCGCVKMFIWHECNNYVDFFLFLISNR